MTNQTKDFCKRLNINFSDELVPFLKKGKELYAAKGLSAVDKERIISFNNEYNIFRKWFDDVLAACDEVSKDEDLLVYIYTLVCVIKGNAPLSVLEAPDRARMDTDFAPLFALLYFLEDMIDNMKRRGCTHQIISDTLYGFDSEMNDYYAIHGRSGMRSYIWWFLLFVRGELLRIGRFQFQILKLQNKIRVYTKADDVKVLIDGEYMHRDGMIFGSLGQEDEAGRYYAEITQNGDEVTGYACNELGECVSERITLKGYTEVLRAGDDVISVHIPSDGPLDYDYSEKSYAEAKELFQNYYPEYNFKAFYCDSWLLEKRLKAIMGRETNITRFADGYITFPTKSTGSAVYGFLFNQKGIVDPSTLPENSSMHTKVKEYLSAGNIFHEKGGVRLF